MIQPVDRRLQAKQRNRTMNMTEFFLQTHRFRLRPFRSSDAQFMVELNSDPEVIRYTGDGPFDGEDAAKVVVQSLVRQYQERRMGRFLVLDLETGEKVGWCGLKWHPNEQEVDLGYRFFRRHWGKGIATETSLACLDYGFIELGLAKIVAHAEIENAASVRVLEKLGFQKSGPSKYPGLEDGEDFVLLREDYRKHRI
jgi:ribosomal-protein-alanine N-acetyltransferase